MNNLAIFASGNGSNAKAILEYFFNKNTAKVAVIVCNKPNAGVCTIAKNFKIPLLLIDKNSFYDSNDLGGILINKYQIDLVILAGFLWKLPENLVNLFPKSIINIHPSLLPKFGGKGMFGMHVHRAVIANNETESGISIHYVDQHYDTGAIIAQFKCSVDGHDTPESLALKINKIELKAFPTVIEQVIIDRINFIK